jgi:hypothetical protein
MKTKTMDAQQEHYASHGRWRPICDAPVGVTILLAAENYAGPGVDVFAVGIGTAPPDYFKSQGACVWWQAILIAPSTPSFPFGQKQDFTPTHWQPLSLKD